METLSGKTALAEIDKVLTRARSLLGGVSGEFAGARDRVSRLQQREISIFARLARLRLAAIEQGTLVDELEKADREVTAILGNRDRAAADLDDRIRAAESALADSETRRAEQQAVVAAAGDALDAAEAKAQAALEADEAWQEQLDRTERADFVARQADEKAAAAGSDRAVKGEPYEQDPLFSYLWERGYGTSKYRAIPVTRWLDGRVARLCGYESARQNYSLLIELPIRLGEHAERMRAEFDREAEALAALERGAAEAAGVPKLGDRLTEAQDELGDIDERIVERENALRALIADRKGFASGEDEYYSNCLDVLGNAMRQKGLPLLEADAARTPANEDNELVQELAFIRSELADIEQDLAEYGRLYDRERDRVGGLEDVRRRFKASHYDDSLSEFVNGALISLVLNQFLSGTARSGDVWKTIKRQQRTKQVHANPNFGTLKFPRAGKHGPWRMPGGFGRGGSFGGGGFKTGGGFRGGGGFKTGGGF